MELTQLFADESSRDFAVNTSINIMNVAWMEAGVGEQAYKPPGLVRQKNPQAQLHMHDPYIMHKILFSLVFLI